MNGAVFCGPYGLWSLGLGCLCSTVLSIVIGSYLMSAASQFCGFASVNGVCGDVEWGSRQGVRGTVW